MEGIFMMKLDDMNAHWLHVSALTFACPVLYQDRRFWYPWLRCVDLIADLTSITFQM